MSAPVDWVWLASRVSSILMFQNIINVFNVDYPNFKTGQQRREKT